MHNDQLHKTVGALTSLVTQPLSSIAWVYRGSKLKDRSVIRNTYWTGGELPRVGLQELFADAKQSEIVVPNAFERDFRTSVTIEEACNLAALVKSLEPKKILEIGTFDGNTTLLLASNSKEASVVTVDLPPDFDKKADKESLKFSDEKINLTPRDTVGIRYKEHPLSSRIRQVYGDSASIDWSELGGPFDVIFIDGCHTEKYVRSDSLNALPVLADGGVIVWHDYGEITDVTVVVDSFAKEHPELTMGVLEGTRLAIGVKEG